MRDIEVTDETLEQLFAGAGSDYEVPADAFERVLAAAGEAGRPNRARFQHPRLVAAAVLIIAAAGGASLWGGLGRGGGPQTSQTASRALPPRDLAHGPANAFSRDAAGSATQRAPLPPAQSDALAGAADGAKVVHTGSLSLTVPKGQVSPVLTRLTGLAGGLGGYVSSTSTAESGSQPTGTVVLRVPAGSFDSALAQARTFGTVTASTSKGADVTAKAADEQAQLTSLKRTRDQFLLILAKAKTIGETLSVQQRVDDTQAQIDQVQGQINVLADQSSYGTLTATVVQKAPAVVPKAKPVHHQSGLSKAWHRAVDGFVTGAEALIARSGRALLVLLVLAVGLAALRAAWKVGRRRLV